MSLVDYMRQGSGGQVNVSIEQLPSKGFIDAIKVRDVCKARILHGAEREDVSPGSPDVKLTSASGEVTMLTRAQLVKNYRHSNNKKIVIAFLKNNTNYVVIRDCKDNYKVMKLPDNCIGNFKGNQVKSGSYLVCKQDGQGNIDMGTLSVVAPALFRKMFKIPMQPIIKKHMHGKGNKMFSLFTNMPARNNSTAVRTNINRPSIGNNTSENNVDRNISSRIDSSELGLDPSKFNVPTLNERKLQKEESKYRFKVVNSIMSMQNPKQQLGFTVQELSTGKTRKCSIPQVVTMCEQKLVENVKLVQTERGTRYLAGVGIVLKNLPQVLE